MCNRHLLGGRDCADDKDGGMIMGSWEQSTKIFEGGEDNNIHQPVNNSQAILGVVNPVVCKTR